MSWPVVVVEDSLGELLLNPVDATADVPSVSMFQGDVLALDSVDAAADVPDVTFSGTGTVELALATVDAVADVPSVLMTVSYPTQAHGQTGAQPRAILFPGGMKGLVTRIRWNQEQQRYELVVDQMPGG